MIALIPLTIADYAAIATLAMATVNLVVVWRYGAVQTRLARDQKTLAGESGEDLREMRAGLEELKRATDQLLVFQESVRRQTRESAIRTLHHEMAYIDSFISQLMVNRYDVKSVKESVRAARIEEAVNSVRTVGVVLSEGFDRALS